MKKPNITEGEWKVDKTNIGVEMVCVKNGDLAIADCAIVRIGKEQWLANLQAISAVPDMIDALIGLVWLIESNDEFEYRGSHVGQIKYDEAVKALKKAGCTE